MGLTETLIFYLLVGIGVAAAVLLRDDRLSGSERLFRTTTAVVFWPMYVPVLLQKVDDDSATAPQRGKPPPGSVPDAMDAAIAQVETELDTALTSLSGWAEGVLAREDARLLELRATWRFQADRIRELDLLLAQPSFVSVASDAEETAERPGHLLQKTEQARRENLGRLKSIRGQMYDDLMGTLAWVRELVTMIHLAKFTGAPASRAEDLVSQIAAAVAGLSEVSQWRDESGFPMGAIDPQGDNVVLEGASSPPAAARGL
jgi:hypothetical protein